MFGWKLVRETELRKTNCSLDVMRLQVETLRRQLEEKEKLLDEKERLLSNASEELRNARTAPGLCETCAHAAPSKAYPERRLCKCKASPCRDRTVDMGDFCGYWTESESVSACES